MRSDIPTQEPARSRFIARAEAFAVMYRSGATLADIGNAHGITRERVRQYLAGIGITGKDGGGHVAAQANAQKRGAAKDAVYLRRHGVTRDEYWSVPSPARRAFTQQKVNAKKRGIAWELTVTQWWKIWQDSGKWAQRGRGQGYCMGRHGDAGPYAVGNVYICTIGENFSHSYIFKPYHVRKRRQSEFWAGLCDAARSAGMHPRTLYARLRRGWSLERALTTPLIANNTHLKRIAGAAQ